MSKDISREERATILALNSLFGFTPTKGRAILQHLEDPRELFYMDRPTLIRIGIREERQLSQLHPERIRKAMEELDLIESMQGNFITIKDKSYPELLAECKDAPIGFYLRSGTRPENIFIPERPAIAIVGTRDISPYGTEVCIHLVRALAQMHPRPLIVSGLALGVDITAHTTALEMGLPTLAVMATGIDRIYPARHEWAAEKIMTSPHSGLMTDYPLRTSPQAFNFIRRNRIMAGMCMATILIESKIKGGGLITAQLASSYNREVYAVPGRIGDLRSKGCNYLIAKNIANALVNFSQLVPDLGFTLQNPIAATNLDERVEETYRGNHRPEEIRLLKIILHHIQLATEIQQKELVQQCQIPYEKIIFLTGLLESDGFIRTDLLHNCSINKDFI